MQAKLPNHGVVGLIFVQPRLGSRCDARADPEVSVQPFSCNPDQDLQTHTLCRKPGVGHDFRPYKSKSGSDAIATIWPARSLPFFRTKGENPTDFPLKFGSKLTNFRRFPAI